MTSSMTREEFISRQVESERRIRHRVIPFGVIYAVRLASPVCIIILAVLLWICFETEARNLIFLELVFCVLLFAATFLAERNSRKQLGRLGLKCPSCQGYLIFSDGKKTAETGYCPHCGARVFES